MHRSRPRPLLLACATPLLLVATGGAQVRAAHAQEPVRGWELPWLDISPNGGWRVRARAVAAARARLLAQRRFPALNAPVAPGVVNATAVTGTLRVPVVMFRYKNSAPAQYARDTAQYNATLFGVVPPNGKPYTLRSFYEQMANGQFSIQGRSVGWVALDSNEVTYTGVPGTCPANPYGTNCNGVWSGTAFSAMQRGLREALAKVDAQVDFAQYDDDGDGVVDAVLFLHPSMDGACTFDASNNHLWSHRDRLQSTGAAYVTNDPRPGGGGNEVVNDYILQSGLGSAAGGVCDSTAIMPIGTAAHELGHILALPDLYDVFGSSEGIGEWGLMGSGNYAKPESPSRLMAWSLQQLGWTTIVPLDVDGTYSVGAEPLADTVFLADVQGDNPRNEFFLIENRQAVESDSAMIRIHCARSQDPAGCGGGLMLWHVDGAKACMINVCTGNNVNTGLIHGVALEEADGLRQLWGTDNRGDAGDPYPGVAQNSAFSFTTTPPATKNVDGTFVGFAIDSIQQLVPNGALRFQLRFGALTTVMGSDTSAAVQVDGAPYTVFRDILTDGSSHSIAVADTQFTRGGRTRLVFQSWSDGGAISHTVTGSAAGSTYTAALAGVHRLAVTVLGNGTVTYDPPADSSGTFIAQGTAVTLTAMGAPPAVFGGWEGDTTATTPVLVLPMGHPFDLTARFDPPLTVTASDPRPGGIMGKAYADTLLAAGGTGAYSWDVAQDSLPPGLALDASGIIAGTPTRTGTWSFVVRATSGAQQVQQRVSTTITAPPLTVDAVVAQLLTGTGTLSVDDINYLDLLGNHDGLLDVGDFLAWTLTTGVSPTVAPPVVRAGGRP